jgi:hypothetical protein
MRIELDATGVAELARRFGELHDSVIRRFSCIFVPAALMEIGIEALALDGVWWRLTLAVSGVSEFRLAEGVAVWGNEASREVTTNHPDGTTTREMKPRDLGNLRLGGPTNRVIFAAAIHVVPEGIFVDLSPRDLVAPSADPDPASWRTSTFYVFGRTGEALLEPLDVPPEASPS